MTSAPVSQPQSGSAAVIPRRLFPRNGTSNAIAWVPLQTDAYGNNGPSAVSARLITRPIWPRNFTTASQNAARDNPGGAVVKYAGASGGERESLCARANCTLAVFGLGPALACADHCAQWRLPFRQFSIGNPERTPRTTPPFTIPWMGQRRPPIRFVTRARLP